MPEAGRGAMTLRESCEKGREWLERAGVSEAGLDAWYLLEYVTGISRACYLAEGQRELSAEEEEVYFRLVEKRAERIPLQHLTGVQEFMGLEFYVNEQVLIPRQDTEVLVEEALKILQKMDRTGGNAGRKEGEPDVGTTGQPEGNGAAGNKNSSDKDDTAAEEDRSGGNDTAVNEGRPDGSDTMRNERQPERIRLLDMCTGSGCVLLSILKLAGRDGILNLPERKGMADGLQFSGESAEISPFFLSGTGADISEGALETARRNADSLGVHAEFCRSDLFENVAGRFRMILSNPPYIKYSEIEKLQDEVRLHDPLLALDGGEDGLSFYRRIIYEGREYLQEGGYLLLEIGYDQAGAVTGLMHDAGFRQISVKKDLAGLDRVVTGLYDGSI